MTGKKGLDTGGVHDAAPQGLPVFQGHPAEHLRHPQPDLTGQERAARHRIAPQTGHFPMSRINEAFARLESGQAHYRIVLDADF